MAKWNLIVAIHVLKGKLNLSEVAYRSMIAAFSDSRVESSKGLYDEEANNMRLHLQKMWEATPEGQSEKKQRNKIKALAMDMPRWFEQQPNGKLNWAAFERWMREKSYLKKELNQYTLAELPKLVSQFESLFKSYLKAF